MSEVYISQGMRHGYIFKNDWFQPGGCLHGDNLLCRLTANAKYIKLPHGKDDDPDYLLLLWMYANGDNWTVMITPPETIFLYKYFSANGFDFMIKKLEKRQNELNNLGYLSYVNILFQYFK